MSMLLTARILLAIVFTAATFSASAQTLTSGTSGRKFGTKMAELFLRGGFSSNELSVRQKSALSQRNRILNGSPLSLGFLKNQNMLSRRVAEESALASIPLIEPNLFNRANAKRMPLAQILFQEYKNSDLAPVDRTDLPEVVVKLQRAFIDFTIPEIGDENLMAIRKSLLLADPIVTWLLSKGAHSVSPQELLEYTNSVFDGDSISAVAVLGELFYQETMAISKNRNKEAFLASRMIPLINEDTKYQVGHNYHFWRVITASLYRGGTRVGRIYGYVDNQLPSYRLANTIGFDAADSFMSKL